MPGLPARTASPGPRAETGHQRGLVTVFGEVTVTRMAYRAPGAANLHPADAQLNLPEEKHPHGMRKLAAIESGRGSFESAAHATSMTTGPSTATRTPARPPRSLPSRRMISSLQRSRTLRQSHRG